MFCMTLICMMINIIGLLMNSKVGQIITVSYYVSMTRNSYEVYDQGFDIKFGNIKERILITEDVDEHNNLYGAICTTIRNGSH